MLPFPGSRLPRTFNAMIPTRAIYRLSRASRPAALPKSLITRPAPTRYASTSAPAPPPPRRAPPPNPHASYYSDIVPAMIPIFLIGSAVYLGLQLLHSSLEHEQASDKALARIAELEAEVDRLQAEHSVRGAGTNGAAALHGGSGAWWKFW